MSEQGAGRRLIRGSASRGLAFGVGNALAAVAAVLLLRHLGVADFGRYGTVIALLAMVQGLSEAGLGVTAMRELSLREPEEQRELLAHVVGARIVLTAAGVALAIGFAALAGYGSTLVLGTLVAGTGVLLASVQSALLLPLNVQLRNGALAVNELVRQGTVVAVIVVLVLVGAPLGDFFLAQLAAGLMLLAFAPLLLTRGELVRPRWDGERLRELARLGLPVAVAGALAVVYYRMMVIIVSLLEGEEATGLYVTAARVLELVAGLPIVLSVVAVPLLTRAARDDRERLQVALQRMTEVMALVGVAVALGLVAGARPVVLLLGGEEFEGAAVVLRIQAFALVTIFLGAAWTASLIGLGRLRQVATVSASGVAVLLVAGVSFTAAFGIEGSAAAIVLADVVLAVGLGFELRRAGPGRELDLRFLWRGLAALVPAGLVCAAAVVIEGAVLEAVLAVAAAAGFLGLAYVLGLFPSELVAAARRQPAG